MRTYGVKVTLMGADEEHLRAVRRNIPVREDLLEQRKHVG